jgi:hypothetical protein
MTNRPTSPALQDIEARLAAVQYGIETTAESLRESQERIERLKDHLSEQIALRDDYERLRAGLS